MRSQWVTTTTITQQSQQPGTLSHQHEDYGNANNDCDHCYKEGNDLTQTDVLLDIKSDGQHYLTLCSLEPNGAIYGLNKLHRSGQFIHRCY